MTSCFNIDNKVYHMCYYVNEYMVAINTFGIEHEFRGRKFSYRIFDNILKKYGKPILLECHPTLYNYYVKLGFKKVDVTGTSRDDIYYVMKKEIIN